MKNLERIKNYFRLFSIKRNEAIYTCIQNDIPLTDENIKEVMGILKQKENKELFILEYKNKLIQLSSVKIRPARRPFFT